MHNIILPFGWDAVLRFLARCVFVGAAWLTFLLYAHHVARQKRWTWMRSWWVFVLILALLTISTHF